MKLFRIFVLGFFAVALIACGGAEERKAVYLEKAKSSIAAGDLDKARIELKNVLQIDPKDADAYYQLGRVYEKQKEYRKAYSNYLKAEELNPDLLENQAQLGKIYLMLGGDTEKTKQKIDFILSKDPKNKDGLLLKATLMLKDSKVEEAIAISKQVVESAPEYIDGVTFLATLYFKDKRSQKAIKLLEESLLVNQENETLNRLLGLILVNAKEYDRAEVIYKALLEKQPNSRNSYNTLALFYNEAKDEAKAEQTLRASIENDPKDVERHLALIKYIISNKGNDAAIESLKLLVKNNNGMGSLRMALAELLLATGDKQAAIDVYKGNINDFSEEVVGVESRISLASIYLADKNIEEASKVLDAAIEVSPNDPKIHMLRAKIALYNKDTEKALISLRIVTKEMPKNINAYFLLVGVYQMEGNIEQIQSTLNAAYKNNVENPNALLQLAEYYFSKDIDQAEKVIHDFNLLKKNDYDGMAISAAILNRKKQYPEAYKLSEKIIALFPERSAGYNHAVPYLVKQKEKAKAISLLEEGYKKTKNSKLLLNLLTTLQVSEKEFDVAIERIKEALKTDPAALNVKMLLAKTYMAKGDFTSAELALKDILFVAPKSEEVYLLLSQVYQKQNDMQSLISILKDGKENIPASIKIPLKLSAIYETEKNYSGAMNIYRELNESQPDNLIVTNNLVSMLSDHGDKDDLILAKKLLPKLETTKQHVFLDTIGWVYYRLGDTESAINYLSQAVEQAPKIGVFNYHLGMAYKQAGDKTKAKLFLENSVNSAGNFREKEQAKAALKKL